MLLVFGDSISVGGQRGITKRYTTQVAEGMGLIERSYAVNGSAFGFERMDGSAVIPTISEQVSLAAKDDTLSDGTVDAVLIGGGTNDATQERVSDSLSGLSDVVRMVRDSWPDARILINLGQGGFRPALAGWNQYKGRLYDRMLRLARSLGAGVIPAWRVLYPVQWDEGVMEPDGLHPAQAGHDYMASAILGAYQGGLVMTSSVTEQFQGPSSNTSLFPSNSDVTGSGSGHYVLSQFGGDVSLSDELQVHVNLHGQVNAASGNFRDLRVMRLPRWAVWHGGNFKSDCVIDNAGKPMYLTYLFTQDSNGDQWIGFNIPPRSAGNPIDINLQLGWRAA